MLWREIDDGFTYVKFTDYEFAHAFHEDNVLRHEADEKYKVWKESENNIRFFYDDSKTDRKNLQEAIKQVVYYGAIYDTLTESMRQRIKHYRSGK